MRSALLRVSKVAAGLAVALAPLTAPAPTLAAAAGGPGATPGGPAQPPRVSADVVSAAAVPASLTAAAGGEVAFKVRLEIADTWHLYDHSYVHDPDSFYIGIDLMPGEEADLAAYEATYPPGKPGEFMGEKVSLLYERVEIAVSARLPESASGQVAIPLVLTVQACDSKICLQPSEMPLAVQVRIE